MWLDVSVGPIRCWRPGRLGGASGLCQKAAEAFSNIGKEMLQWQVSGTCQWNWGQASRKAKHLSSMSFPLDFHVICHQKMSSTCRMDLSTSHDPLERIPLGKALQLTFSADSRATRLVNRDYHRSQASHDVEVSDYQSAHQGPGLRRKSNYHLQKLGQVPRGCKQATLCISASPQMFVQIKWWPVCSTELHLRVTTWWTPGSQTLPVHPWAQEGPVALLISIIRKLYYVLRWNAHRVTLSIFTVHVSSILSTFMGQPLPSISRVFIIPNWNSIPLLINLLALTFPRF